MNKNNWLTKKLGEICEKIKAGGTPSRKISKYWGGEIPFVKIEDLTSVKIYLENTQDKITQEGLENSNAWILPPNSVLFSIYASIGEVAINKIPVATNQAILGLIPKSEIVDPKFLAYSLKKFGKYLISYNIQSTQKNLTLEIVKNFEIPFPPLPIQQKIVKILDTIQEAIDIHDKIIEKTKELKKSLMNLLFHYGLAGLRVKELASSRVGELTSSEIEKLGLKLKKTEVGEIPEDCEVVRLGDVCELRVEQVFPKEDEIYVGLEHIDSGEIRLNRYGKGAQVRSLKNKFYANDILYNKLRPYLDKAVIVENEGVCSTDILVIKCNERRISPHYLINLLHTPQFLNFATSTMTGTNHPRTSWDSLKIFKLPLPPLPEQQEIAEILQTIDQKIEIEKKKKELYEELFKTMLNKIMSQQIDINLLDY